MTYSSSFFDGIVPESLSSAKVVVPLVIDLVGPASVVDIGCATGAWLSVFREHKINHTIGIDGEYVDRSRLLIPLDCFMSMDLAKPFSLSDRFDLAMSLEVAEHLPTESASGFVRALCQLAPIVLFSAAIPGQGGEQHVNEQWPEYWRQLFAGQNFRMFDPFRPALMHDGRVASWYRQNIFLFIRNDHIETNHRFMQLPEVKDANGLLLIDGGHLLGMYAALECRAHTPLMRRPYNFFRRLFLKRPVAAKPE